MPPPGGSLRDDSAVFIDVFCPCATAPLSNTSLAGRRGRNKNLSLLAALYTLKELADTATRGPIVLPARPSGFCRGRKWRVDMSERGTVQVSRRRLVLLGRGSLRCRDPSRVGVKVSYLSDAACNHGLGAGCPSQWGIGSFFHIIHIGTGQAIWETAAPGCPRARNGTRAAPLCRGDKSPPSTAMCVHFKC